MVSVLSYLTSVSRSASVIVTYSSGTSKYSLVDIVGVSLVNGVLERSSKVNRI